MERLIHWGTDADVKYSKILLEKNQYETACQWIEWLIHGFPWFVFATLGLLISYGKDFNETVQYALVILNLGLYFDLILVAIIKFNVLRERPVKVYSKYLEHTIDVYSFPSGHSSRATMLVVMLYYFAPIYAIPFIPLPLIVGISRVALGRHYITDVIAGIAIGIIEARLMLAMPFGINTIFRGLLK